MKSILRTAAAGVAIASFGIASAASAATTDSATVTAEIVTALSVDVDPLERHALLLQCDHGALHIGAEVERNEGKLGGHGTLLSMHLHIDRCNCIKCQA